jgi:hypothetical protein
MNVSAEETRYLLSSLEDEDETKIETPEISTWAKTFFSDQLPISPNSICSYRFKYFSVIFNNPNEKFPVYIKSISPIKEVCIRSTTKENYIEYQNSCFTIFGKTAKEQRFVSEGICKVFSKRRNWFRYHFWHAKGNDIVSFKYICILSTSSIPKDFQEFKKICKGLWRPDGLILIIDDCPQNYFFSFPF